MKFGREKRCNDSQSACFMIYLQNLGNINIILILIIIFGECIAIVTARPIQASMLYEAATTVYPDSVLAWTARAVFFDVVSVEGLMCG